METEIEKVIDAASNVEVEGLVDLKDSLEEVTHTAVNNMGTVVSTLNYTHLGIAGLAGVAVGVGAKTLFDKVKHKRLVVNVIDVERTEETTGE